MAVIQFYRTKTTIGKILKEGEEAEISIRFENAYTSNSTEVAIAEGTNLLATLNNDLNSEKPSPEKIAALLYTYTRLYRLYAEAGDVERAELQVDRAFLWFNKLGKGPILEKHEIVKRILAQDRLIRTPPQSDQKTSVDK